MLPLGQVDDESEEAWPALTELPSPWQELRM